MTWPGRADPHRELHHVAASPRSGCGFARTTRGIQQAVRRRFIEYLAECVRNSSTQRTVPRDALRKRRIPLDGGSDIGTPRLVEFAVGERHQCFVIVIHALSPLPSSERVAASALRPRARRLVRVPMGISSISAASLYDIPSTSTHAMASR
jgi:hypothetical protein